MNIELDDAAIATILSHMNEDHADAVLGYAQRLGGIADAESAELIALDASCMTIRASVNGVPTEVEIAFDRPLKDAQDARKELIALSQR